MTSVSKNILLCLKINTLVTYSYICVLSKYNLKLISIMENAYRKAAISNGVILGVISALLTVILYAVDLELFTKWWIGILSFIIILTFGILSAKKTKALVQGFTSFKQAFTGYFITIVIGTAIGTLVSILLFNVIDTDASVVVQEKIIEATEAMMTNFGAPESEIDKAIIEMEKTDQFGIANQAKGWVYSLAFYAVIGLIVALVFREKDPNKA